VITQSYFLESKIVVRLLKASKKRNNSLSASTEGCLESADSKDQDRVLLFVRIEGENYACLGRVQHIAVDLTVAPIQIKWELMDFEQINKVEYFQTVLAAGKSI